MKLRDRAAARMDALTDHLRTSWWLLPGACVAAAIALSHVVQEVDDAVAQDATAWYLFKGGVEGAREVLSTIATSMMTFTGIVFSVTVLVLQLASNQFSPRVLRTFLKDRQSQLALGTFVGTFVYALLGLRKTRGEGEFHALNVPSFTVWLAVVLALACVATFIAFIHHIAQSIRVIVVIRRVGDETRRSLERMYPEGIGEGSDEAAPVLDDPVVLEVPYEGPSGVLAAVDAERLEGAAREGRAVLALVPRPGDFVAQGSVLFEVRGDPSGIDLESAVRAVFVRMERDVSDDVAFGIRELVDIAERALSPGINDPSTAVQVLDELHDILRRLARRRFPSTTRETDDGTLFLVLPRLAFDDMVRLALDEIRQYGGGSIQVLRRMRHLVEDVLKVAPPGRRGELRAQLAKLDGASTRGMSDPRDLARALRPSPQG